MAGPSCMLFGYIANICFPGRPSLHVLSQLGHSQKTVKSGDMSAELCVCRAYLRIIGEKGEANKLGT
jgi:hypothetical protein